MAQKPVLRGEVAGTDTPLVRGVTNTRKTSDFVVNRRAVSCCAHIKERDPNPLSFWDQLGSPATNGREQFKFKFKFKF